VQKRRREIEEQADSDLDPELKEALAEARNSDSDTHDSDSVHSDSYVPLQQRLQEKVQFDGLDTHS
jgi:hypothetical protein